MKSIPVHICIITTAHPIDDVRVNYKFAHAFREAGFRVSWVGPNHAFFDWKSYNHDGVQYLLSPPNCDRIDRLLSPNRIKNLANLLKDVDVYYAPDPDSAPVALYLAKKNGAKVIFDIHEIYHGTLLNRWIMGWGSQSVRNCVRKLIKRICSKCDLVLGVSDAVLVPYLTDRTKYMVVRSCAPLWFGQEKPADVCGTQRKFFNVMHGKSDLGRGTSQVIESAAISHMHVPDLRVVMFRSVRNYNAGGAIGIDSRIQELGLSQVIDIRPNITIREMPRFLQTCDVGLIAYGRDLGVDSLPNRLFEYMAAGLAIIAPSYSREIVKIVEAEKCGILVDFEDPNDIARGIIHLRENPQVCREMGRCARNAFLAKHNWETEVQPIIEYILEWGMRAVYDR